MDALSAAWETLGPFTFRFLVAIFLLVMFRGIVAAITGNWDDED
jgi:hypothetical protein